MLKKIYGDLLLSTPEAGFDVSVQLDLSDIPNDWEDVWVTPVGRIKRNCFAAVFERYFDFQEALEKEEEAEGALKQVLKIEIKQ